jgi:hypothetical protein
MRSVPELWGRMYDVLPRSAKGTRNGTRNWIPVQRRKGMKKLVSSDFAKILEYETPFFYIRLFKTTLTLPQNLLAFCRPGQKHF